MHKIQIPLDFIDGPVDDSATKKKKRKKKNVKVTNADGKQEEVEIEDYFIVKQVQKSAIFVGDKHIGRLARMYASKTGEVVESRNPEGKVSAVNGTKGYLWKQAEDFKSKEDIDLDYYQGLVNNAVKAISRVGDERIVIDNPMFWTEETKSLETVES